MVGGTLTENEHMKYKMFLLLVLVAQTPLAALEITSLGQKIAVERVASNLGIVWGFDFLQEGHLILAHKDGRMSLLKEGHSSRRQTIVPVKGVPPSTSFGQGGLMDVRVHPKDKSQIFFSYVSRYQNGHGTIIARATLQGNQIENVKTLFRTTPPGKTGRHFGSRIVFGAKDTLFFGVGDRGERDKAQLLNAPNGKLYRIHRDGRIPKDNPFVGKKGALPAIWSYGHRNPQGMAIHPATGDLWEQEHGPRGGDEINHIIKGANYGWPIITYGREYWGPSIGTTHKEGMRQPVKYFVPSIAPSSLMIYSGKLFSQWKHHFFSAALELQHLNRLDIRQQGQTFRVAAEERLLKELNQRIRHVREAPSGKIWFSTDQGNLYQMRPALTPAAPSAAPTPSVPQ